MSAMTFHTTPLRGVMVAETRQFPDHRGAFSRLFCAQDLSAILGERRILQVNHSLTRAQGAIRGLHFQRAPHAEMKFVRCIAGRVWDVAVDLRHGSPTFLRWYAEELSPQSGRMLVVPEGCAHGFQVLEENSEMLYLHTAMYQPNAEGGMAFDDPALAITWPLLPTEVSEGDRRRQHITHEFTGLAA